jgi:hypothetical protein
MYITGAGRRNSHKKYWSPFFILLKKTQVSTGLCSYCIKLDLLEQFRMVSRMLKPLNED